MKSYRNLISYYLHRVSARYYYNCCYSHSLAASTLYGWATSSTCFLATCIRNLGACQDTGPGATDHRDHPLTTRSHNAQTLAGMESPGWKCCFSDLNSEISDRLAPSPSRIAPSMSTVETVDNQIFLHNC